MIQNESKKNVETVKSSQSHRNISSKMKNINAQMDKMPPRINDQISSRNDMN